MLQHPEIGWIERTGYPSRMQPMEESEYDEDAAYKEKQDERLFEER